MPKKPDRVVFSDYVLKAKERIIREAIGIAPFDLDAIWIDRERNADVVRRGSASCGPHLNIGDGAVILFSGGEKMERANSSPSRSRDADTAIAVRTRAWLMWGDAFLAFKAWQVLWHAEK